MHRNEIEMVLGPGLDRLLDPVHILALDRKAHLAGRIGAFGRVVRGDHRPGVVGRRTLADEVGRFIPDLPVLHTALAVLHDLGNIIAPGRKVLDG